MNKIIYLDTESIGLFGPTVLIQWAIDDGPVQIHNIFKEPVYKTLRLIELMCDYTVVGFNLAHDSFHINRTYGVLKQLPLNSIPSALDIYDFEKDPECHDQYCVKPKQCIDYLVLGKKSLFQSVMKQKDIKLKKVPKILAPMILEKLKSEVKIPDIYFKKNKTIRGANWRIIELKCNSDESLSEATPSDLLNKDTIIDPDFVNIKLTFNPSAALKNIVEHITGKEQTTIDDLVPFKKPVEYGYFPTLGEWIDVADEHIYGWTHDEQRLKYAARDIECLRIVRKYYEENGIDCTSLDTDSELAWAVGACYWRGFKVNLGKVQIQLDKVNQKLKETKDIQFNSPAWVLKYLHLSCSEIEKIGLLDTKKETLHNIIEDKDFQEDNPALVKKCAQILNLRNIYKEKDLYEKLLSARRLHVQFKVIGTKSNRMSGGGEFVSKGNINPQGIKSKAEIREMFPLAFNGMDLDGGDFDGFEVSIAEAEYNDSELRKDLLSGKKMHGIFAEVMYDMSYAEIMKHKKEKYGENHPLGYYERGKRGFFGRLYGAQINKLMDVLWLSDEQIYQGLDRFFKRYNSVKASQDKTYDDHQALMQPNGRGTKIIWKEPKEYVESFLGFRRYFSLEFNICRILFNMAQNLRDSLPSLGKNKRIMRRDRLQTPGGAAQSAIYAAAFNIQSQIMRSAVNHKIQSPGGEITKELQFKIWDACQPYGCNSWKVMLFNVHDELMIPRVRELKDKVKQIVHDFLEEKKEVVPLISMTWKQNLEHWGEK